MSKLITASIDVTKINKSMLIVGQKGTYLNVSIWVNDEPDKFGNDVSIQQKTDKDAPKIYLGNGKTYKPTVQNETASNQQNEDKDPSGLPF